MPPQDFRRFRAGAILGYVALVSALGWIAAVLVPYVVLDVQVGELFSVEFVVGTMFVLAWCLPALIFGLSGTRLRRRTTKQDVRRTLFAFLLLVSLCVMVHVDDLVRDNFGARGESVRDALDFIIACLAVANHVLYCCIVLWHDGIPHSGPGEFYTRPAALFLSYLLLCAGLTLVFEFGQTDSDYFGLLGFLPLAAAFVFYKLSRRLVRGRTGCQDGSRGSGGGDEEFA